jgi:DNA transposition AAA+ family ATPase
MVKRIASRCGISDRANTAALIDRIKNALTPEMVLILDEVHLLQYTYRKHSFFACMEVIREIFDETNCGLVLSGTLLMVDKLEEGAGAEMEQVLNRGVHRFRVGVTRHDIAALAKSYGLPMPKASDDITVQGVKENPYLILKQLSGEHGLLHVTERLRYAGKIAARGGNDLTWEHFVTAHLTIASEASMEEW